MFLTRFGCGSKIVVIGDVTRIDLCVIQNVLESILDMYFYPLCLPRTTWVNIGS